VPQQANSTADFHHSSSPGSATSTKKGSPSSTNAAGSNPTGQSNFHIAQSYVRVSTNIVTRPRWRVVKEILLTRFRASPI
jgi:hypothetical protein